MEDSIDYSPLQLKELIYTKVLVEAIAEPEAVDELWAQDFDYSDIPITTNVVVSVQDGQEDDPRHYSVALSVQMGGAPGKGLQSPYRIDIRAQAWFELAPVFEIDERESIVRINGASMMIGAIREVVIQLTSRSVFGPLILPSLRFLPGNGRRHNT